MNSIDIKLKEKLDDFLKDESNIKYLDEYINDLKKNRLMKEKDGTFSKKLLENIKKESLKKNANIALGGLRGSYADQVGKILFPKGKISYFKRFSEILDAIDKEKCHYGILPLENSSYGSVKEVYKLMLNRNFYILASYKLDIKHCLLAYPSTKFEDIKEVYSHPQALGQCSDFLENNNLLAKSYYNTALCANLVKEKKDKNIGAIASKFCAKEYGLDIINSNIQNEENNYTRFIVVAKDMKIYENSNKISIRIKALDKPGSLIEIIEKFKILGINMTKLESSPIPGSNFEFVFYFDFDGNIKDKKVRILLDWLSKNASDFKFLGNYIDFSK